jgi:peptidoglycan/LPS O-acetylase OafA/YrhL
VRHRYELDGVRALAVSAVIFFHTSLTHVIGGWIGVDVFFVLSGFLITSILMAEWERTGGIRLGRFYAKRALRLYPALILMFAGGLLFYRHLAYQGTLSGYRETVGYGALYLEDFVLGFKGQPYGQLGHTWSLALEEQFYVLWAPILLLTLRYRRSPALVLGLGTVTSFLLLAFTTHHSTSTGLPSTYYRPDARANELLVGCLVALVFRRYGSSVKALRPAGSLLAPLALAGLFWLAWSTGMPGKLHLFLFQELAASGFAACLVFGLMVAPARAPLNRLLRCPPLVWLGKISYGMYLYMVPVLLILPIYWHQGHMRASVYGICEYLAIVGVASLSYYLVERRFLVLKDRLSASAVPRKRFQHSMGRTNRAQPASYRAAQQTLIEQRPIYQAD